MPKQNNKAADTDLDLKQKEKELLKRINVLTTDGDKLVEDPLYYAVEREGRFWKVRTNQGGGMMAESLKGSFLSERDAKKAIVRHELSKIPPPPKRPKFKYKTVGRPTLFRRKSISWKEDYVYGASKTDSTE